MESSIAMYYKSKDSKRLLRLEMPLYYKIRLGMPLYYKINDPIDGTKSKAQGIIYYLLTILDSI